MDGVGDSSALFANLPKSKIILKQKVKKGKETSSTSSTESSGKLTFLPHVCAACNEFLSSVHVGRGWGGEGGEGTSEELGTAGHQRYDM